MCLQALQEAITSVLRNFADPNINGNSKDGSNAGADCKEDARKDSPSHISKLMKFISRWLASAMKDDAKFSILVYAFSFKGLALGHVPDDIETMYAIRSANDARFSMMIDGFESDPNLWQAAGFLLSARLARVRGKRQSDLLTNAMQVLSGVVMKYLRPEDKTRSIFEPCRILKKTTDDLFDTTIRKSGFSIVSAEVGSAKDCASGVKAVTCNVRCSPRTCCCIPELRQLTGALPAGKRRFEVGSRHATVARHAREGRADGHAADVLLAHGLDKGASAQ